jgi:hypothetical protein
MSTWAIRNGFQEEPCGLSLFGRWCGPHLLIRSRLHEVEDPGLIARPPREMQQVRCSAQAGLIAAFLVGYLIGALSCFGRFRGASFVTSPSTKAILVQAYIEVLKQEPE